MGKVSIGFRGWRFDEEAVFDEHGNFRPFDDIPPEPRHRLVRLVALQGRPCDACWLEGGDEDARAANAPEVVYGEPLAEVLLCADHERDFYYWFAEAGGERHAGTEEFQDRFHEWFAAGNRAPGGYGGVEHVETEPADLPDPHVPDQAVLNVELPEDEQVRIDLREMVVEEAGEVVERHDAPGDDPAEGVGGAGTVDPADLAGLDLDAEYPVAADEGVDDRAVDEGDDDRAADGAEDARAADGAEDARASDGPEPAGDEG